MFNNRSTDGPFHTHARTISARMHNIACCSWLPFIYNIIKYQHVSSSSRHWFTFVYQAWQHNFISLTHLLNSIWSPVKHLVPGFSSDFSTCICEEIFLNYKIVHEFKNTNNFSFISDYHHFSCRFLLLQSSLHTPYIAHASLHSDI